MGRDRYDDACTAWKHFLADDRSWKRPRGGYFMNNGVIRSLAESFMDWGYAGSGISVLKTGIAKLPRSPAALEALGYGYLHLNRPHDALVAFHDSAVLAAPGFMTPPRQPLGPVEQLQAPGYAYAYVLMGDFGKARTEAQNAPQFDDRRKTIAFLTYFAEGKYAAASRLMTTAPPRLPSGIFVYLLRRHLGELKRASAALESTRKSHDGFQVAATLEHPIEFNALPGTYGYFRGKLNDSQFLAQIHPPRGRVIVPELCAAYYLVGERHLLAGDSPGARRYFQKAVDTRAYTYAEWVVANARLKQLEGK